jgi:hypothetical protein
MATKKTETTKKTTTKKTETAKKEKTQTVVLTIQATYILKGNKMINPDFAKAPDKFPLDTIDLNVCPGADKVDIKKLQVFETEEVNGGKGASRKEMIEIGKAALEAKKKK